METMTDIHTANLTLTMAHIPMREQSTRMPVVMSSAQLDANVVVHSPQHIQAYEQIGDARLPCVLDLHSTWGWVVSAEQSADGAGW